MTDAELNRATLRNAFDTAVRASGLLAMAAEMLGSVQSDLLMVSAYTPGPEAISLISMANQIKMAIELQKENTAVLGTKLMEYSNRF